MVRSAHLLGHSLAWLDFGPQSTRAAGRCKRAGKGERKRADRVSQPGASARAEAKHVRETRSSASAQTESRSLAQAHRLNRNLRARFGPAQAHGQSLTARHDERTGKGERSPVYAQDSVQRKRTDRVLQPGASARAKAKPARETRSSASARTESRSPAQAHGLNRNPRARFGPAQAHGQSLAARREHTGKGDRSPVYARDSVQRKRADRVSQPGASARAKWTHYLFPRETPSSASARTESRSPAQAHGRRRTLITTRKTVPSASARTKSRSPAQAHGQRRNIAYICATSARTEPRSPAQAHGQRRTITTIMCTPTKLKHAECPGSVA
eukprot:5123169-Alexandrium_andersonii.AAC.1